MYFVVACAYSGLSPVRARPWRANRKGDGQLTAHSSLWMFPIYGMAAMIGPAYQLLKSVNIIFRGLIRLDYAPLWFLAGLTFERLLRL